MVEDEKLGQWGEIGPFHLCFPLLIRLSTFSLFPHFSLPNSFPLLFDISHVSENCIN